jgi:hypothetical protein
MENRCVTVHGFKDFPLTAGLKGCIFIPIRRFVDVLYGKTDRFYIPQTYPPLPTSWDMRVPYMTGEAGGSGTWCLVMMLQTPHFLRGFLRSICSLFSILEP